MSRTAVRAVITGRVQGVGYRAWVEAEAAEMGLSGWVRNRRDGTVEAVFAGPSAAINTMLAACRDGPPFAGVASVQTSPIDQPVKPGFRVLPTA